MLKRVVLWLLFLPVQLAVAVLFALTELVRFIWTLPTKSRSGTGPDTSPSPRQTDCCSIIMLNWNGRELLQESLPALQRAVSFAGGDQEVIVVDNGSTDDSVRWVRENYPQFRVVGLGQNLGFAEGNNRGVEMARHDLVVLLNNDMIVQEDFLPPLLGAFADPQVFAVSSQILFPEGKRQEETGATEARFERGYLHLSHQPILSFHDAHPYLPVLWAGGGSSAFQRRRFLELGGFSTLFSPCYVEDTDLSYRAWRRGWKAVLAAHSKVLHKHRSSSAARFTERQIKAMVEERKLWYLWKNYQLRTLLPHFLLFPLNLGKYLPAGTYIRSLRKLLRVLFLRALEGERAHSDRELLQWVQHPLTYLHSLPRPALPDGARLRVLIVSAYLPYFGRHGGAGRVFQLLRRVAREHEVSLITFLETEEEFDLLRDVRACCRRVEAVYRRGFQPVSPFPYEPFEEFNCPDFRQRLEQVMSEDDFDVVHFEWTQMAQYADLAPRARKLVTEIEVNYAAHRSLVPFERNPFRKFRKFYNSLQTLYREVELCRRMDAVVCVTDTDREYLQPYMPAEKLFVMNTGVDTRYFTCNAPEHIDPNAILFVGAFRHEPNIDAMLYFCAEIFPSILNEWPQAHLYIVGSGPPHSIVQLGAHPNIEVTGFVEDIRHYYRKARLVVVPLRTGVGIRGKILEGWAAGKAMVATSQACLGIRAVHGENILIADGAEDFALWTLALLRHPEYAQRLGQAGREVAVQYYDWDMLGERMISLYEKLAGKTGDVSPVSLFSRPPFDEKGGNG